MAAETNRTDPQIPERFDRLYKFHGGLKLPGHRDDTTSRPLITAGIPATLVIPLQQHIGEPAVCVVNTGQYVRKGQVIAEGRGQVSAPVHASSSGTVSAIEERAIPHPSGLKAPCVVIETDGRDEWHEGHAAIENYRQADPVQLVGHIRQAGIVGLGGAGFPTQAKLGSGADRGIELLLVNGVECEPYISCDNILLRERAAEVVAGTRVLQHILKPRACIIAIEDNMPVAGESLRLAVEEMQASDIQVISVPDVYPTGGERQLVKVLTGLEVPSQGFPADIGIICQNVGTVAAVYRAVVKNQPLVSRIVTVAGSGVETPRNLEALIGTPISALIKACGGYTEHVDRLLMGGPMMGFALNTDDMPVIKTTNCVLVATRDEMPPPAPEKPCIRCGLCTDACPANLLPQQLYWYARSDDFDRAQDYKLFDCIECGCCSHVCPSQIPLVQYYRYAKTEIWAQEKQKKAADIARRRHQFHEERLARIKRERAERLARKKQVLSGDGTRDDPKKAAIQAALERVRRKKDQMSIAPANVDNLTAEQQKLISEVNKRRQTGRSDSDKDSQ